MKLRKKNQVISRTLLFILYAFGNGGRTLAGDVTTRYDNYSESTEPSVYSNTIPSSDHTVVENSTTTTNDPSQFYTSVDYSTFTQDVEETSTSSSDYTGYSTTWSSETTLISLCNDVPNSAENLTASSTSNSIVVTWNPSSSNDECLLFYNITWYSDKVYLGSNTVNSTESEFVIPNLTSSTSYNVSVVTIGVTSSSVTQFVSCSTTRSQIPQVNNLVIIGIEYGLIVTWDPPNDVSNLKSYLVNVSSNDDATLVTNIVPSSTTTITLNALIACSTYLVQVTPVGTDQYEGTTALGDGTTLDSIPGVVHNLMAVTAQITGYSVYIKWSPPTSDPNCVLYYSVDICLENNCRIDNTTTEFYDVTGLDPCLKYTFTVRAVGDAGSSSGTSVTAETLYVTPGVPLALGTTAGQFSLFFYWKPPLVGSTCVRSYRITLWDDGVTETTSSTNITMRGLYACKTYTAGITPVSVTSGDGQLGQISGRTDESVHNPPEIRIKEVTKSSISIIWHVSGATNWCKLKNALTTCNFTKTDGQGFDMLSGQSIVDISSFNSTSDVNFSITVSNLSPFTYYDCFGVTENIAGSSESGTTVAARTSEDVPSAPAMTVSDITNSAFTLNWKKPEYLAGILIEHEIIFEWLPLFLIPSSCDYNETSKIISGIEGFTVRHSYSNASAYSNYTARIRAKTNAGWGNYSNYVSFPTHADVPGAVTNLKYLNTTNSSNMDMLNTFLSWKLPCSLNGEVESFEINLYGTRVGFTNHSYSNVYPVVENITADKIFEVNFGELKAEYYYTFEVLAKVAGVSQYGPSSSYNVIYPAGIPPLPSESYMDELLLDPHKAQRTSSTAYVLLPLFDDTNGDIKYYAIMITESGQTMPKHSRFDILSGNWPNTTSWQEAMSHTPASTYQATAIQWHPAKTDHIKEFDDFKAVKIMLGDDDSCPESSANSQTVYYCNGPLRPDAWYQVRMRAFTNGGYRDSLAIIVKTKAEFNLGLVIGVVFGILFIGIITTMMLLVRKGVLQTVLSNLLHPNVPHSPGPDPFTRKKFELHCKELIENPGKLSNEFQLLQTLSVDLEMSTNSADLQANRKKNRYTNILPYDITRVKLELLNNDPNTDYINASFIQGYTGVTEYIACQGPKEETTYDFWRMVFQYNVKTIAMVTQLVEKGKDKCYQYYPNTRENFEYEDMTIRCSTQLDFVFYKQRIITLEKGNIRRNIMHLHFKEWSDHGVPDDIHSMIHFCQIVRKQMNDNRGVAVVHCSAGVGRTGTLIAIDILLQQIKGNKKLDVFGTVYKLRQHRMHMVQTESQYAYIYNCIRQAVNNPYPPKLYKSPSAEPIYENLSKKNKEITDSNTNLVNSAETLKKMSPSASINSMDPEFGIRMSERPIYTTQLSSLSYGLRYSKSTSAIDFQVSPSVQIVRYGSHEYPIFEPAPDSPSSRCSTDRNSLLDFTRPITIETTLTRPKLTNRDKNAGYS